MASWKLKKKRSKRKKPVKTASYQLIPETGGKRRRRYVNTATGDTISYRQYRKIKPPKPLNKASVKYIRFHRKLKLYQSVRDDYIRFQKTKGVKISKREAINSAELKKIVRDLHSKSPQRKAEALEAMGRIAPEEIIKYVEQFEAAA